MVVVVEEEQEMTMMILMRKRRGRKGRRKIQSKKERKEAAGRVSTAVSTFVRVVKSRGRRVYNIMGRGSIPGFLLTSIRRRGCMTAKPLN
jgi:hypothetical protein